MDTFVVQILCKFCAGVQILCKSCANFKPLKHLYMAAVKLFLDTRRIKNDSTYPIKLRVSHNKIFYINTEFSAAESSWDGNEYNKNERNYRPKNMALRNMLSKVENHLFMLEAKGKLKSMSDKTLKEQLTAIVKDEDMTDSKPFTEYIDDYISRGMKGNTAELYAQTKNKILAYDPQCTFETMNLRWLEAFDRWMAENGMKTNSRSVHMRNIRTVFNYAIDNEETTLYPFRKFTIKKEETRKRSLTAEQLAVLRDFPCEDYQEEYRDMFMLMFYLIGINAVDLFHLKGISNGRAEYKREKTGRLYSIKVEPEAIAIIEKYKGVAYLLNVLERNEGNYRRYMASMNRGLAKIGEFERKGQGGKKIRQPLFPDISSYWSRHTWATIAASLDIPKETISAALGHELGSRVTSIYIDFDQRKVDEANRKVIDYVNGIIKA